MARISVNSMFGALAELGQRYFDRPESGDPVEAAVKLCHDLMGDTGEATVLAIAADLVERIGTMEHEQRVEFLDHVSDQFAPDPKAILDSASAYLETPGHDTYLDLAAAVDSPRQELMRRFNMAPGATASIIGLRTDILGALRDRPHLKPFESDMRHLLASWFNRGFLEFERIDWNTPAAILEKLIEYEAVHEISGWDDLRRRLAEDRRCFAFFHPALPGEPLIFVQVALTDGIAGNIQEILTAPMEAEVKADTAIFYSISNCQAGLAGISFGDLLIKQVAEAVSSELPEIKTFSTLSPIPGFRRWLEGVISDPEHPAIDEEQRQELTDIGWTLLGIEDHREELTRLCARYLIEAKRHGRPLDPVARFHLGNGASVERLNWQGDTSDKGLTQSATLMVNYRYDLDDIVANHEAFKRDGKIAYSSTVKALLNGK